MKYAIEGFRQEKALMFRKETEKNEKTVVTKLDCADLVVFRWIINTYPINEPIKIDYKLLISELPILDIKEKAMRERLQKMCELGLLEKLSRSTNSEDIVNLLKSKNMHGLGLGKSTCKWCGVNTSVLHNHHYPIPKSKGGTDTVDICPNCHHEFHSMSDGPEYKVNIDILSDFDVSNKEC